MSLYPEFVKGVRSEENTGHLWHLDMDLLEKRRGRIQVMEVEVEEEEDKEEEEEDEVEDTMDRWSLERLSNSCPQTDLQRCALEILAGVKRPTTVSNKKPSRFYITISRQTSPVHIIEIFFPNS